MFDTVTNTDGGAILDVAHYVLTLRDLDREETGQFGPSIVWKFAVANANSPDQNRIGDDGEEYQFWVWTSPKLSPRAKARPMAEALLGRSLDEGEKLNPQELLNRRMKAFIIHETGDDGKVRAKISQEVKPTPFGSTAASKPTPSPADGNGQMTKAELAEKYRAVVKKMEVLEVDGWKSYKAADLDLLSIADLKAKLVEMGEAVRAAAATI